MMSASASPNANRQTPSSPNSSGHQDGDQWVPLVDYSVQTGVSLSTLRRHIKAGKVVYRVENGRYLLLSHAAKPEQRPGRAHSTSTAGSTLEQRVQQLERQLQCAHEEIAELKMLVALYEEKNH